MRTYKMGGKEYNRVKAKKKDQQIKSRIKRCEWGIAEYKQRKQQPTSNKRKKEHDLIRENKIAYIIGKLSQLMPGSPDYDRLEEEYRELIMHKNE